MWLYMSPVTQALSVCIFFWSYMFQTLCNTLNMFFSYYERLTYTLQSDTFLYTWKLIFGHVSVVSSFNYLPGMTLLVPFTKQCDTYFQWGRSWCAYGKGKIFHGRVWCRFLYMKTMWTHSILIGFKNTTFHFTQPSAMNVVTLVFKVF